MPINLGKKMRVQIVNPLKPGQRKPEESTSVYVLRNKNSDAQNYNNCTGKSK
jgi:hypothetical protein